MILKIKQRLSSKKGFTLIEVIVSFVLLGILMSAAIATLSPAANVFLKVKSMTDAQSVSSTLMEKIGSELETATGKVVIKDSGHQLEYEDRTGYTVIMSIDSTDHHLHLTYQAETGTGTKNVNWYFPNNMYMNQNIESLEFKHPGGKNMEVTIKLKDSKLDSTYSRTKVVQCFRITQADISEE